MYTLVATTVHSKQYRPQLYFQVYLFTYGGDYIIFILKCNCTLIYKINKQGVTLPGFHLVKGGDINRVYKIWGGKE